MKATDAAGDRAGIAINARFKVHKVTGVQRYAHEITSRLGNDVELISPKAAKGAVGHLWEQTVLPIACGGRLLWSPSAAGPVLYGRHVVTFHDLFPVEYPEWYSPAYALWNTFLMRRLAVASLQLIAVSAYTKSRLVAVLGCDPARITVIHNGLTSSCTRVGEQQVEEANKSLDLPSRRYILSLSSLEARKNLRTTLRAWVEAQRHLPQDVWLVLAGAKPDETVYGSQRMPADVPRVHFTGYVPEHLLGGLYSGASLFVFPSLAEGFGLPLLEAMACGVRCITSNTSSLPEVGGDAVEYVDPLDAAQLAHAIRRCYPLNCEVLLPYEQSLERAKLFSWEAAAAKTRQVLELALATRVSKEEPGARGVIQSELLERGFSATDPTHPLS